MPDQILLIVGFALAAIAATVLFLAVVLGAAIRRARGLSIGPRFSATLALTGGLTIGTYLPLSSDLLTIGPILAAGLILIVGQWRRGRRVLAGWVLAGLAFPWTILWGGFVAAITFGGADFEPISTWASFGLGVALVIAGVVIASRGDPPPTDLNGRDESGFPAARGFGTIARAIREPGMIGPFGLPELAALFAVVAVLLVVPFLIPSQVPSLVAAAVSVILAAIAATEAYIRAMPSRSRRAFEAFSWLGEWQLDEVRRATGGGVPKTRWAARRWLRSHPERPEETWFRVEILLLAGDHDGARELADRLPAETPEERFERASAEELVDWRSGGNGTLDGMEAAAVALEPVDGDARLRAEVAIAAARVRRLAADPGTPPGAALEPLLVVRQRLGARADGQVGRALRRRILPVAIVGGLAIMAILRFVGAPIGD